ncbi:hypothetical protein KFL_001570180 [Klebsormidium nitens]|uniref:Uncharacterized protein n=1 Tax=Klebsormidium nitens TaxID=105231 RepID=A0A0U9HJU3_KLENI|nr:hypothetical protein KFL_001570180 [Klebsormidium nitens]|eukprot:GAQ83679.1 hypothetical protein KFL_001570180 [Klebsormidium nitens]
MGLSTRVTADVNLGSTATSQEHHHHRGFGTRLRRHVNKRAANILHTFRKEEKMKVEYANEEEELAALTEQRYKLASGLKRTLLRIGVCFVVLAVIKILNSLREALLVTPVDYFKLVGVLSSLDYWALAFLVFDIRNTIMEIEKNDVEGDPTVRVLEQENVAIGISFEKFFKRMFKVLSAIAFAQLLGVLSVTGFQLAPDVDNGLRQLWGFVSPHL